MSKKVEAAEAEGSATVTEAAAEAVAIEADADASIAEGDVGQDPGADAVAGELVEVVLTCFYGDGVPGEPVRVDATEAARLIEVGAATASAVDES